MKSIADSLTHLMARRDYVPLNVPELLQRLRLPPNAQQELQENLARLERAGAIARIKGNRYVQSREADLIPGRIRMNRGGKGFLQPDDASLQEIEIPEHATGTALNEDRVLVRREGRGPSGRGGEKGSEQGAVVRILERRRTRIVGTLRHSAKGFVYVVPDDPRVPLDIYVPPPRDVGRPANDGDKVVVELGEWVSRQNNPEGEIVEVLGSPDAEGVDMLSVLRQYDLPLGFAREVLDEARSFGREVEPHELEGRVDCRHQQVITIDPDDAKDFDDAICLERRKDQWRLWVHIADVSHYVKPGTALDTEARKRGNSTYLVDRVIPMLPEALSNELCSLKPNVDRLTKCVEFALTDDGAVVSAKVFSAVIHSKRRFSYQEAFAILQRAPQGPIEEMLHQCHQIAQKIRRRRFKAGSLELDFPEMKIRLDERGRVSRIEKVQNDVSHQLIEEFMLLANEAVAARLMGLKRGAVYRVHEAPDEKRLREYREDVLSHNVPCGNLSEKSEVQKLLRRLDTLPIGQALKIGFLRSLMRARYAVEPLGHYGLAKQKYTHFTSPIRRYADLVVHRALFDKVTQSASALSEIADHISLTERNSADAERDSKDVKLYAFLRGQLKSGEPTIYPALVTGLKNFGFFVDVPGLAMSGLVPLSTVEDDFYVFDQARNHLVGRRTRQLIKVGDNVQVQVAKVDSVKKQVDFRLASTRRFPRRTAESARSASGPARHRGESQRPARESGLDRGAQQRRRTAHGDQRASPKPEGRRQHGRTRPQGQSVGRRRSHPAQRGGKRRSFGGP
ncbi:MAG TPA: ribonuclease R [Methylomirabilota bacterium]|nr:ribonuclease R [Methylomirabilota bacterium]